MPCRSRSRSCPAAWCHGPAWAAQGSGWQGSGPGLPGACPPAPSFCSPSNMPRLGCTNQRRRSWEMWVQHVGMPDLRPSHRGPSASTPPTGRARCYAMSLRKRSASAASAGCSSDKGSKARLSTCCVATTQPTNPVCYGLSGKLTGARHLPDRDPAPLPRISRAISLGVLPAPPMDPPRSSPISSARRMNAWSSSDRFLMTKLAPPGGLGDAGLGVVGEELCPLPLMLILGRQLVLVAVLLLLLLLVAVVLLCPLPRYPLRSPPRPERWPRWWSSYTHPPPAPSPCRRCPWSPRRPPPGTRPPPAWRPAPPSCPPGCPPLKPRPHTAVAVHTRGHAGLAVADGGVGKDAGAREGGNGGGDAAEGLSSGEGELEAGKEVVQVVIPFVHLHTADPSNPMCPSRRPSHKLVRRNHYIILGRFRSRSHQPSIV